MRLERDNPLCLAIGKWVCITFGLCWFTFGSANAQDIRDFASGNYVEHVRLSPNGDKYSKVTFDKRGQSNADIFDRRTHRHLNGMFIPAGMSFGWVEWASDTTLLASITTNFRVEDNTIFLPVSRIVSFDVTGQHDDVVLFANEDRILRTNISLNRVVDMLPSDPDHIIMGAWKNRDFDLFHTNLITGDATRIAKGGRLTLAWFTDAAGRPSLRMDCSSRNCRKIRLFRPEEGANPMDQRTEWTFFRSFDQKDINEETFLNIQPVAPTGEPDEYYVLDGRDERPRRTVRIFNIRTDEFKETLFEDPDYDVSAAIIDPRTRQYAGAKIWRDRLAYEMVDTDLQTHMDKVNHYFDDSWNVSFQQIADDRSAALIYASAPDERGAYYLYDFETQDTNRIASVNPNLHNAIDTRTDVLKIPARDGTELTAYHTKPETGSNGALVMLIHGGPELRDVLDYHPDVQFLASRGYEVVQVNFRGSSGYGRDFAQAGYRQWGGVMHTDIIDATAHMQNRLSTDPGRTCIVGHSYGAYAALLAGAKQPQLYACIVAGSGPSDLRRFLKDEREAHGRGSRRLAYWQESIGDSKKDRKALEAISPIRLTDYYDDPVLLIHGTYDRTVLIEHSERMEEKLKKAGKSVEFLRINGGHQHSGWSSKSRRTYLSRLEAFVDAHIGDDNETVSDSP